ncbi:MAG: hypothetical protein LAP40_09395 [Acidobacteriia bacterium]|nr:hypothetical protein [Terriglobia bacterium]
MKVLNPPFRSSAKWLAAGLLLSAAVASAQNTGWRRFDEPGPNPSADPSTPVARTDAPVEQNAAPPSIGLPSALTLKPGTYLTVRTNDLLSSDRNHAGDLFTATLTAPLVVDGIVVAQRGQTVAGRVAEVDKGGRIKGVSRLGIQLTELTAVDGQQLPIQTQFVGRSGNSEVGRDVATVATTTGVGAVIGAAADWGRGAAIGAGAGAAAGLVGVLLSHGAPAVIYPESALTFRVEAPVLIATDKAPQAFRTVDPSDYQQAANVQYRPAAPVHRPAPYYAPYPYAYGYPYPYYGPYGYGPFAYGPSFGVIIGGGGYYGRGGFYRGRWR